jgi:Leucine-rich repeat (LRR) protein
MVIAVLLVALATVGGTLGYVPPSTVQALRDLWEETGGPYWSDECWIGSTWNDMDPCDPSSPWFITGKVVCDASGSAVTKLLLQSCDLTGSIPDSIGNLVNLQHLHLYSNNLTGSIPDSVGNLVDLTTLGLNSNNLSGSIPDSIGNLVNLQFLNIYSNNLTGSIPDSIGNLVNLQHLGLNLNNLSGSIPDSVGNLVNLQYLYLFSNNLAGSIPDSIGNLVNLLELYLNSNNLSGLIPDSIGNLVNLQRLFLNWNNLTGSIPDSIGNLVNLQYLELVSNNLAGSIPDSIGNLVNLQYLELVSNNLAGSIPDSIGNLVNLAHLGLNLNNLTGAIPYSIGNLVNLMTLALKSNNLNGSMPDSIGNLVNLQYLELVSNNLAGSIPDSIGNLVNLRGLGLQANHLNGSIPASVGNFVNLEILELQSNELTGTIPLSLRNLTRLRQLNLESNQLTGDIPSWIGNYFSKLQQLRLGSNHFSGPIPSSLQKLPRLFNFSVGSNPELTGQVPTWLCDVQSLNFVLLEFTGLTGSIPQCISTLTNLQYLDLRGLELTGELAVELFELPRIEYLLLSRARFTGGIAASLHSAAVNTTVAPSTTTISVATTIITTRAPSTSQLKLVTLTDCGLSGEIPRWLAELPSLVAVELSGNDLTGPIPTFPPNSPLQQFSAANNRLSGTLEPLRNARNLTRLDVGSNQITGTVDQWLANRSHDMTLLWLSENYLSCALPDSTSIFYNQETAGGGASAKGTLSLLEGNLFGCPLPRGVEEADRHAESYSCGSKDLYFAGTFFGATLAFAGVFFGVALCTASRSTTTRTHADGVPLFSARSFGRIHHLFGIFSGATQLTLETLITGLLVASTAVLVATLLPVYSTAKAAVECRFQWSSTAAFLAPAVGADAGWGYAVAIVGGLCIGGAPACALVVVGASRGVVAVGTSPRVQSLRAWHSVAATLVCVVTLAILVGLNAGFVLLEESSHASGDVKYAIVLVYALLHELVDHVLSPYIVLVVVTMASTSTSTGGVRPSAVFAAVVAVEMANSVLAPVIALLGASDGCLRDELFASPQSIDTSVNVSYCTDTGWFTEAECVSHINQWLSHPVGVSYTPPFRFDGERCTSSIITLYTPEYLVIFALRILLYPVGWWLSHRGTPWILVGIQPPVRLRSTFVNRRRRLVRIVTCGLTDSDAGVDENEDGVIPGDDAQINNERSASFVTLRGRTGSQTSVSSVLRSRTDSVFETLHAIEPVTHRFNLLGIAASQGMFAPEVAVGAVATLGCLDLFKWGLDRHFGPAAAGTGSGKTHGTHSADHNRAPLAHAVHPLPLVCVVMLLLFNTIYLGLLLEASGLGWAGWTVSAVNWVALSVSCWWSWDNLCSREGHTIKKPTSGHVDVPFELTEMLLPPEHDDDERENVDKSTGSTAV